MKLRALLKSSAKVSLVGRRASALVSAGTAATTARVSSVGEEIFAIART
jgi:hypothetical protein